MRKGMPNIVIVTRETRLAKLRAKMGTPEMARFKLRRAHVHEVDRLESRGIAYSKNAVADVAMFDAYESEAEIYDDCLRTVRSEIDIGLPIKVLDRKMLPTFDFWSTVAVVVVGPDGLVANTAKYVGKIPIIGVNPDPARIDGILLPFDSTNVRAAIQRATGNRFRSEDVSLAQVELNDGQKLLAFNDLFIGAQTHVSARYTISDHRQSESQSSSGIIVSTGAGATGWLSSMFNMAQGIARHNGCRPPACPEIKRDDHRLIWIVREPFRSKQTNADMVIGTVEANDELVIESLMPQNGVIFSDGIEKDYLEFNSGTIARVTLAKQRARLMVA